MGDSGAQFLLVGDCVRAIPLAISYEIASAKSFDELKNTIFHENITNRKRRKFKTRMTRTLKTDNCFIVAYISFNFTYFTETIAHVESFGEMD